MSSLIPCLALAALATASAIPTQPPESHLRLTIRAFTPAHNLTFDCTGIHCSLDDLHHPYHLASSSHLTIDLRFTDQTDTASKANLAPQQTPVSLTA